MTFKFIPNPQGNGMTDDAYIVRVLEFQKHHEEMVQQKLAFSVIGLFALFLLVVILSKYRQIGRAASEGFLNSAAAIIRAKRNASQKLDAVKAKINERVDDP
ncbi:hypothetical protein [Rhizobium sp. P28RR-XV]|uniref:hypothetical protein n=1 Tax=Rhizobium sp. P28RR-XV TaxID=2726737 RepID=UPI0014575FDD|nr:hypothetical protein [Rhizobium sp. P28RR-XV]NLR88651.1 hypothetical protein [Rhizobium sp. P28RR-XV]